MVTKPNPIIHVITGLDTGGAEGVLANLVLQKTKQKKNPCIKTGGLIARGAWVVCGDGGREDGVDA